MKRASVLALIVAASAAAPAAAQSPVVNGPIIFAGKADGQRLLYARAPTGKGSRRLTKLGAADQPAASARGRRLAFTRRDLLGTQIWLSYLDGTGLRRLTTGPTDGDPDWSPEGEQIVFTRGAPGARDIYRINADGTGLRQLTFHAGDETAPAWSVDGRIAFVRRTDAGDDVYVLDPGASRARPVTDDKRPDLTPAWAPTGRTLAVARGRSGKRDIYLVRWDGSRERRLTRVKGTESEPAWSPDGTRIVFGYRKRGAKRWLYLLRVRGKAVRRLAKRGRRTRRLTTSRSSPRRADWQPAGLDPVIAAAGDIACDPDSRAFNGGLGVAGACRQLMTSNLLLRTDLSGILALGDLQYEVGELSAFQGSFHPSWGRLKPLIHPVPGNHEYRIPGAAGYYDYFNGPGRDFGPAGGRGSGYYAFDIGTWHLIALNSECDHIGGCDANSPQMGWLKNELATHPARCTLAFWHRPTFISGQFDDEGDMVPAWELLYAHGADVVLSGHEHVYERFGPQTPSGTADPARGLRQFAVGTGGRSRHDFLAPAPNSEHRDDSIFGVLELTLRPDGYDWRMRAAPGGGVTDSGSGACH